MIPQIENFSLNHLVQQMHDMAYVTDLSYRFLITNKQTVKMAGYDKAESLIDKTYYDLNCESVHLANEFIKEEETVLTTKKPLKILAYAYYANQQLTLLFGQKSLLLGHNQQPCGFYCHFYDLTNKGIIDVARVLNQKNSVKVNTESGFQAVFRIQETFDTYNLSKRETECLYLILRGFSNMAIAKYLNLSKRTIEGYIERVKFKLYVQSRTEIIEKSIYEGLANSIPESIYQTFFNI